jgi:hypothetical protein
MVNLRHGNKVRIRGWTRIDSDGDWQTFRGSSTLFTEDEGRFGYPKFYGA